MVVPKMDAPMRDSPGSEASAADGATMAEAELHLAAALRDSREALTRLQRVDGDGLFTGDVALPHRGHYLLQVDSPFGQRVIEDPYRFGPWLGDTDVWLLAEGRHLRPWEKLGAHPCT